MFGQLSLTTEPQCGALRWRACSWTRGVGVNAILTWLSALWPIAATIINLLAMVGFFWLKTQFAGSKDVAGITTRVGGIELRLVQIEADLESISQNADSSPTRIDLMGKLGELAERMSGMEANNEGQLRLLATQNHAVELSIKTLSTYVHSLIEQALHGASK